MGAEREPSEEHAGGTGRDRPTQRAAAVLERIAVKSRWEDFRWQLAGVVPDVGGEPRDIVRHEGLLQRIYPGLVLTLFRDEAEGYYLNASTEDPSVFVSIRSDETLGEPYAFQATLSYNEAARWMDGGERVERASAWPELAAWLATWVEANYRPEPKRRERPKSFRAKDDRFRGRGE
jgi:hypothetical protein